MSYLDRVRQWFASFSNPDEGPRIIVFGDSHTAALLRAQEFPDRSDVFTHIDIVRLSKEKDEKRIGDLQLEEFCRKIKKLRETDFVFSAVGGNQYAILSTVQNALDFDFISDALDEDVASDVAQLIPMRAITGYIESGIRNHDGPVLAAIRQATKAKVFHLSPPPPKEDNEFISQYFESRFAGEGIATLGPSRPQLRLKCWNAQSILLKQLCRELDIEWVPPPGDTVTEEGFLAPRCYAKDATHANRRYGELVLRQIMEITGGGSVPQEQIASETMNERAEP